MGNRASYPEVDLSGKVAVVTGGNTGIGYWTAKALARLGAHTFIACRSRERAEEVSGVANWEGKPHYVKCVCLLVVICDHTTSKSRVCHYLRPNIVVVSRPPGWRRGFLCLLVAIPRLALRHQGLS